jgi:hypothetical protein
VRNSKEPFKHQLVPPVIVTLFFFDLLVATVESNIHSFLYIIQRMVDPIGAASGIVALVTFALQSSKLLYKTVASFQKLPKFVEDLKNELEALNGVLQTLQGTVSSSDVDLTALELPLRQCGKACKDFDALIAKCFRHATDSKRSFRDWARLQYLGDDVIGFQKMMAGYKSTIIIALSNVNM